MIVEELISKLGLEVDPEAFKTLEEFQHAIHHGIGIAVGAAAAAFAALLHETAEAAIQIGHVAEVLDMSTERLGELKFAADRSEVSFEGMTMGLKHLGFAAAEAASGSGEMAKAFSGIKLRDAEGKIKPVSELLEGVAEKFNKLGTSAERLDLAKKVFGRSGPELIPFLKNLEELTKRAHEFGTVFSEEDVAGAREFVEGTKDIRDSLIGLRNAFAVPFLEPFGHAFAAIAQVIVKARPYVARFGLAIRQVAVEFWGILKPVRETLAHLGELFSNSFLGKVARSADGFSALKAVMLGLLVVGSLVATTMVGAAIETIGAWLLAASPFILLGALIGFIIDDVYRFIKGGDSLIGRLQKWGDAIGSPDEHPIVKMLRKALALLLDVTDPKHWEEFKAAAGGAVDFVSGKIHDVFGKKFAKDNNGVLRPADDIDGNGNLKAQAPQSSLIGSVMDTLGFKPSGLGARTGVEPTTTPNIPHLIGGGGTIAQTNHITINGSGLSKEEHTEAIQDALENFTSNAMPAVSGSEN